MAIFKCSAEWTDALEHWKIPEEKLDKWFDLESAKEAAELFCELFYDAGDHDSDGDEILEVNVQDESGEVTEIVVEIFNSMNFKAVG